MNTVYCVFLRAEGRGQGRGGRDGTAESKLWIYAAGRKGEGGGWVTQPEGGAGKSPTGAASLAAVGGAESEREVER